MDNYIVIQRWMIDELNLSGNELLVFAIIYGFCQDGESEFYGSRKYIANMINVSLPTVDNALKSLLDKELIIKDLFKKNNISFIGYKISLPPVKNLACKNSLHNNKNNNINNKKEEINNNSKELLEKISEKPKKKNLYQKCLDEINDYTDNFELQQLLTTYLKMRLEIKDKQMYANQWKGLLRKLDKLSDNDSEKCEIVERSIDRGYASFYELPKNKNKQDARDLPWNKGVTSVGYTDEELDELDREEKELNKNGIKTRF